MAKWKPVEIMIDADTADFLEWYARCKENDDDEYALPRIIEEIFEKAFDHWEDEHIEARKEWLRI